MINDLRDAFSGISPLLKRAKSAPKERQKSKKEKREIVRANFHEAIRSPIPGPHELWDNASLATIDLNRMRDIRIRMSLDRAYLPSIDPPLPLTDDEKAEAERYAEHIRQEKMLGRYRPPSYHGWTKGS